MTNETPTVTPPQMQTYANMIEREYSAINRSWLNIAELLVAAEQNTDQRTFKALIAKVPFSYSTARKLIKIAKSERISKYRDKLTLIDAWSTLHELSKLDEPHFAEAKERYLSGNTAVFFTRSDIEKIKNGTCAKNPSRGQVFLKVRIDTSGDEAFEAMQEVWDALANLDNNCIQVEETGLDARLQEQAMKEFEREQKKALAEARAGVMRFYKNKKKSYPRLKGMTKEQQWLRNFGLSKEELQDEGVHPNTLLVHYFGLDPINEDILGPTPNP